MDGGKMRRNKKQYIPKVGDRVKLVELHRIDAFYDDWKRGSFLNSIFIIDEICPRKDNLCPYFYAKVYPVKSGKMYFFCAAKFARAPKNIF